MPIYTVQDNSGRKVKFEWNGAEPPTDSDYEEVFASIGDAPPPTPEPTFAKDESIFEAFTKTGVTQAKAGIARGGAFLAEEAKEIQKVPSIFETFAGAARRGTVTDTGEFIPEEDTRVPTEIPELAEKFAVAREERVERAEEFSQATRKIAAELDEKLTTDPEYQSRVDKTKPWFSPRNLTIKVLESAPLTVAGVGATLLTGLVTRNPAIAATVGGSMFGLVSAGATMTEYEEAVRKDAIKNGRDPQEAVNIARKTIQEASELAGVGEAALEFIPGMMFMKMAGIVGGKQVTKQVTKEALKELSKFSKFMRGMGKLALAEGAEEALQTFKDNAIAKGYYDSERDLLQDVPESAVIGAITGGILGGATVATRAGVEAVVGEKDVDLSEFKVEEEVEVKEPVEETPEVKSARESAEVFQEKFDTELKALAEGLPIEEKIEFAERLVQETGKSAEESAKIFEATEKTLNEIEQVVETPEIDAEVAKQQVQDKIDELAKQKKTAEAATGMNLNKFYRDAINDVLREAGRVADIEVVTPPKPREEGVAIEKPPVTPVVAKTKELAPEVTIGKTTLQGVVDALAKGDLSVLPDIEAGIKEHGVATMQDRVRNMLTEAIFNRTQAEGIEFDEASEQFNKIRPEVDRILSGETVEIKEKEIKEPKEPVKKVIAKKEPVKTESEREVDPEFTITQEEPPKGKLKEKPEDLPDIDTSETDQIELFSFGGAVLKAFNRNSSKGSQPSKRVVQVLAHATKQNMDPTRVSDAQLKKVGLSDKEIIEYRIATNASTAEDLPTTLFREKPTNVTENIIRGVDEFMGVISTRLANISPKMKTAVRKYLFRSMTDTYRDTKRVQDFIEKFSDLSPEDQFNLTKYLMNGDLKQANPILKKNGMSTKQVDQLLLSIKQRVKQAGFDIATIEDYFPRVVHDVDGLLSFIRGKKEWSAIDEAIRKKEKSLPEGESLTDEQKAEVADTMLRGFQIEGISLKDPATDPVHAKKRKIETLDDKLASYYMRADKALMIYLRTMNSSIAKNQFFGKAAKESPVQSDTDSDLNKSIGTLLIQLKKEDKISSQQEKDLRDMLFVIFNPAKTGKAIRDVKEGIYMTTLVNPISALTQLGDMALSAEKSGVFNTVGAATTAAADILRKKKKSEISMEDIGIEHVAVEIENEGELGWLTRNLSNIARGVGLKGLGKDIRRKGALGKGLELSGFSTVDRLGKTTALNASLKKLRKMARKGDLDAIKRIFGNKKENYQPVVDDLIAGKNSDDVLFLLFNELSDIQPITIAEVPEQYLRADMGKLFYALKTFQIKLLDIYRNEIYNEYRAGNRKQAVIKLFRLTTSLAIMNASADELKDFILGRKTDFKDKVIDSLLRLGGMSKFIIWKARREGAYTALINMLAPPFGMTNDVFKDVGLAYDKIMGLEEEEDKKGFRLPKYFPLAGKLYYWWFGNGVQINDKALNNFYHDKIAKARFEGNRSDYVKFKKKARDLNIDISKVKIKNRVKKLKE